MPKRGSRAEQAGQKAPVRCVMNCHVRHSVAEALRFRSCISFAFRSPPSAPPRAWAPSSGGTLFARVSCVRARARLRALAPARFARLIARETAGVTGPCRASPAASAGVPAGRFMEDPCIVSWHVMFLMPPPKLCGSVPAYRSSIASRSTPFHSLPSAPPPPGCPERRDPFCARIVPARPRLPARVLRRRGSRT